MKSKAFSIMLCGLSVLLFSNGGAFAQSEKQLKIDYKLPLSSSESFTDFIKNKITLSKSTKISTYFIVFKVSAEGKISDITQSDEIPPLIDKELKAAIAESGPFWTSNFKFSEMKWVVLPVFLGKFVYPNSNDMIFKGTEYFISMENQFKWLHSILGTNLRDVYFSSPLIQ